MSVVVTNGFKIYEGIDRRCLLIESDRIDACMSYFYTSDLDGVTINRYHGYNSDDISFLREHRQIKHVEIVSKVRNPDVLESLHELRYLLLSDTDAELDFAAFEHLEELYVAWGKHFRNLGGCAKNLRVLSLSKYGPRSKDLSELAHLPLLEEVEITSSPITSLKGLGQLKSLRDLQFFYLKKLEVIDEIAACAESLRALMFDTCRKIRNHAYVKALNRLRVLAFNNCGEMPSISFIREMSSLRDFRFVDTNVQDGDMTPCIGLDNVAFTRKRGFSHSDKEIKAFTKR